MKLMQAQVFLILMLGAIASFGQSEKGDITLRIYAMPSFYFFDSDQPLVDGGINYGLSLGYKLRDRIILRAGLEYHQIDRSIVRSIPLTPPLFTYDHRFYEILVEATYQLNNSYEKINFYVLGGGGAVLGVTVESSDPDLVEHRLFYHQSQMNVGFGNSFEVSPQLFIIGEGVIKVDPGSVIGEFFSFINYSYLVGLRLGMIWKF